jgi:lipopolysaccharide transport protein LptA
MASSPRNNSLPLLAAAFTCGLLGVANAAPAPCTNQEIVVEAKPMEVDYRNNNAVLRDVVITQCDMRIEAGEARVAGGLNFDDSNWTISGDVRIRAEGGRLNSDKAVVSFRNKLISRAIITGTPATFEQVRTDGTTSRGRAGTIDYETNSGTVSFSNNAWLLYGRNEITAQKLVYNIRTQSMQGQPRPNTGTTGTSGNDRIRIVIQPQKPDDKAGESATEPEKKP